MDHHEKRQARVFSKPPFNSLEEIMRGVFKKHPEPRKIVTIGPKDTSGDQHGHRRWVQESSTNHQSNHNIW
jgi:hypothetical protein